MNISPLDIATVREELAQQLARENKPSLYSSIDAHPTLNNAEIRDLVARVMQQAGSGHELSNEQLYAVRTLANATERECYDRSLHASLFAPKITVTTGVDSSTTDGSSLFSLGKMALIVLLASLGVYGYSAHKRSQAEAALRQAELRNQTHIIELEEQRVALERDRADAAAKAIQDAADERQRQDIARVLQQDVARIRHNEAEQRREDLRKAQEEKSKAFEAQRRERELEAAAKRDVASAERELCRQGRINNNFGEVKRWCK